MHELVSGTIVIAPEVRDALEEGRGVVALESTIISHGMPYPRNAETARAVEQIVRESGAVPATIAVINGVPRVGLDDSTLELLATDKSVDKVSIRDLPVTIALGRHGATTVSATMCIASLAGVRVLATGGTGGVHRGGAETFDVSADLTELSRTNVAVVSAGVKSILDIGLTLEKLETLGVPVIGYRTREFPAFYSRSSGHAAPLTLDSTAEIAKTMTAKWQLGLNGGLLIANPIPSPDEIPSSEIDPIIETALGDMNVLGISGKEVTPFLLTRILEMTGGRSLDANISLVKNNARLGAEVAIAYASLVNKTRKS